MRIDQRPSLLKLTRLDIAAWTAARIGLHKRHHLFARSKALFLQRIDKPGQRFVWQESVGEPGIECVARTDRGARRGQIAPDSARRAGEKPACAHVGKKDD